MTTSRHVLVLGGTSWLGGAIARIADARGHRVTCLARGRSGEAPTGVRLVRADRWQPDAYRQVSTQDWDAVIDVSWQPVLVGSALAALAGRVRDWIYVSSISVYRDSFAGSATERHEPWSGTGPAGVEDYGPAKVACEIACAEALPADRVLIARAGLIAGYGDRSDRFGYWPARFADTVSRGKVVLAPPMRTPVQVIDVEDLADWLVRCAERGISGSFDAVGDVREFPRLLDECRRAAGTSPQVVAAGQEWLLEHGVAPWAGADSLPLWLPLPEYAARISHDNGAAKQAGLTLRPLGDTVRDALAWEHECGLHRRRRAGIDPEREAELIQALLGDPVG